MSSKLYKHTALGAIFLMLLLTLNSQLSLAADDTFLVDQADSNNFENFHAKDPEKDKNTNSLKDYIFGKKEAPPTQSNTLPGIAAEKHLIASSLFDSNNASNSINNLYKAMLKTCPDGFIKLREWSQKDVSQGAMILQFEYSCQ